MYFNRSQEEVAQQWTLGDTTAFGRFCHFWHLETPITLRTIAYIDGFNLYHGCLSGRARHCRWLDVEALVRRICRDENPAFDVVEVKYFSAIIGAKLSLRGKMSVEAQADYWTALRAHSDNLTLIAGNYSVSSGSYIRHAKPLDLYDKVRVWKAEEKKTDVNIAINMLMDAVDGICEQQILFSNDSDCVPALQMIHNRYPAMQLGLVAPLIGNDDTRSGSGELKKYSHWNRSRIGLADLEACQMPDRVKTRKGIKNKPDHWR